MITSTSVRRAALIAALLSVPGLHAAEVAGVKVDDKIRVGSSDLVLNGAGLRSKVFIKVYVGALYVGKGVARRVAGADFCASRRQRFR